MRLILLSEFYPASEDAELHGGVEARTFYLSKQLAQRGHEVTVVTSFDQGRVQCQRLFTPSVRVIRCPPRRTYTQSGSLFARAQFQYHLTRTLGTLSADLLDAQSFLTYLPAWVRRKRFRRVVATIHDVWINRWLRLFGTAGIFGEFYERLVLSFSWDRLIANSDETRSLLLARKVSPEKVSVIYNGIEITSSASSISSGEKYSRPTICYVGRLVSYKHVDDLIRAVASLRDRIVDLQLLVIGIGPEESALKRLVRCLGLERTVIFLGHIPKHADVLGTVRRSHVFCLPSQVEGFGIVTIEAMAVGTPYVNVDLPVTKEVTGTRGGLFFPPGNIEQLVRQLEHVLCDHELRRRLGQEGIIRARQFDWTSIADQVEHLYRRVLA